MIIIVNDEAWACEDCTMVIANDELPPDWSADEIAEWQARIARNTAGCAVVLGGEHLTGCAGGECECEYQSFSTYPCDVCGSRLAGARHEVTFLASS